MICSDSWQKKKEQKNNHMPATDQPLVKEVLLDAPPSRVWKAITTPEELKQWSFDLTGFEPVKGKQFTFFGEKDGVKFLHKCEVMEIIPEKKMTWLWSYDGVPGDTYVTFELFPEGDQTRLRLTHEGLEKLPQDENYARANFEMGWTELTGKLLPSFLSKKS
jgi:uncharacterized protein YndB with AHSA1/START domain